MSKEPELVNRVYIDGDVLAYRASFSANRKPVEVAFEKVDDLMKFIVDRTLVFSTGNDYEVYLTGSGNFRHEVAVTHPYKGNRKDGVKPAHLPEVRDYIVEAHRGEVIEGQEADDQMAIEASKGPPDSTVIASIDKDMLQVPCWHFNFGKNEFHYSTPEYGTKFFYTQLLTGDATDNIMGLWRVGPAKASKILGDSTDELELYQKVLDAYDGDAERVLENARLLWLRRYEGQMWEPPTERKKDT